MGIADDIGQPKREDSQRERTAEERGQSKRESSQRERTVKKRGQPKRGNNRRDWAIWIGRPIEKAGREMRVALKRG